MSLISLTGMSSISDRRSSTRSARPLSINSCLLTRTSRLLRFVTSGVAFGEPACSFANWSEVQISPRSASVLAVRTLLFWASWA